MTIWFHEGIPRSGKSYEAMVKHALPAIKAGRLVVTNIKGVNVEKIAEVLDMPVQDVELLIVIIPWDQTKFCYKYVKPDCLLLLDEVQDFWPSNRDRLGPEITELITQHGHLGLDIILMGQSKADCHALWRRRIDKLIYFVQKDALGMPTKYGWTLYKQVQPDKFSKVNSGGGTYEKKYFGIYASHDGDTNNKEAYSDDRANLLKRPVFRFGVPLVVIAVIFAASFLIKFFKNPSMLSHANAAVLAPPSFVKPPIVYVAAAAPVPLAASSVAAVSAVAAVPPVVLDYFADLVKNYRPRLAGYMMNHDKIVGRIEFYLPDLQHRREIVSFETIVNLGYKITVEDYGVLVTKGDLSYMVTSWPFDYEGRVGDRLAQSPALTGGSSAAD